MSEKEPKLIGMVEIDGVTLKDAIDGLTETMETLNALGIDNIYLATGDEPGYIYFLAEDGVVDFLLAGDDEDDKPKGPLS